MKERKISLEQRGAQLDEMDAFNEKDKLPTWDEFRASIHSINSVIELQLLVQVTSSSITIVKINETTIEYSVVIDQSLSIRAKKKNTDVNIKDLLGFQQKLERYSQLDAILNRVKNATCSMESEIRVAIDNLRAMSATFDLHLDTNSQFLLRQLELNQISSRGRRYTGWAI